MFENFKNYNFFKKVFIVNNISLFVFLFVFLLFPKLDIYVSDLFFVNENFISEEITLIKDLRMILKNLMIIFPIIVIISMIIYFINNHQKIKNREKKNRRFLYTTLGFLIGPIVGCGIIANLYFKDTWGRARPVNIEEFNGNKIYTPPLFKSDQCERNCSWISGEAAGAFSFLSGVFLMRNCLFFFKFNLIFGTLVIFCRLSMGGHFLSDNLFSAILMIYLGLAYRQIIVFLIKNNFFSFR
tara:strand:+ start:259 stop:981 length:723 start_codon:yes stop_codon:yes gene_type:complete